MPPIPTYPILSPPPSRVPRCALCLGPVGGSFVTCLGCRRILECGLPPALLQPILPLTVALEGPDRWYHALWNYKRAEKERAWELRHVLAAFLRLQSDRVSRWLGAEPDLVTVVPSKRGQTTEPTAQPLFRVVGTAVEDADLDWRVAPVLRHNGTSVPRQGVRPGAFEPRQDTLEAIRGATVLLIDDSWVTGSTVVSTAGALALHGATRVGILVLARVIRDSWWEKADATAFRAYREAQFPFSPTRWPRD